ncbi:uncharacterized protein LOC112493902 [Cephus cinctus]|uniref:Uncharacterized protein LOC112493902 n=1 Tax=Cephus cinctus TaxID=211228 RepID=A0AAJ7RBU7_CEPCN|nr:uncharacterized protein LOC112493902 [Cephus cinctus]
MSIASAASDLSVYGDDDDDRSTMSSVSNERYQYVGPLEAAGYDNDIAPDNARPPQEHDDAEEPVLWVRRNGVYEVADADEAADALAGRDGAPSAVATLEEDAVDVDTQYQTGGGPLLRSQSCVDEDAHNEGASDNDVLPPAYRFTVQAETTRRINRFRLDVREITMAIRQPPRDPDTNMQIQKLSGDDAVRIHTPNLCVVQQVCTACISDTDLARVCPSCGVHEYIFEEDPVRQFVDFACDPKRKSFQRVICVAHNAKGFDAQFVLRAPPNNLIWHNGHTVETSVDIDGLRANGVREDVFRKEIPTLHRGYE